MNTKNLALTPCPFKVHSIIDMPGNAPDSGPQGVKMTYGGWVVTMRVHACDVLGEGDKARFKHRCRHANKKTLVIDAPAVDFSDMGNDDDIIRAILTDRGDDIVMDAFDNSRNGYEDCPKQTKKMQ